MGAATVAVLNTKINADPRGLIEGFSQAQGKTRNFAQTFKQMQSQLQATQARGAALEMSVRSPREELQATLADLGRLRADGVITMETLSRATANARDRFRQLDPVIQDNTRRLQELLAQAEALRSRGNSIAINVRTPREDLAATIRDLQHLRSVGAISQQTLARATADARDRFRQLDPAIQAATARIQEMRSRGASITMDVRTPRESLAATMTELRTLRREGVITFETFDRAAAHARDSVNRIGTQAVSPLISHMKALAAISVTAIAAKTFATVHNALQSIESSAKLATSIGTTVEKLQELRYVASLVGNGPDTVDTGIAVLVRKIGEASQNASGEAANGFARLKLSASELANIDTGVAFSMVASAIGNIPTAAGRAAAAVDVFGKEGQKLLPIFNAGSQEIEKLSKEAGKFGLAFSAIDSAKVSMANDSITRLQASFTGLIQQIAIAATPAIVAFNESLTAAVMLVGEIDTDTIKTIASIAAFALTARASVSAINSIVSAGGKLVIALQKIATAQAVVQALSGPKGWLTLAAGLAVAVGAGLAVNSVLSKASDSLERNATAAARTANETSKLAGQADSAAKSVANLTVSADGFSKVWEKLGKTSLDESLKATEELFKKGEEVTKNVRTPQMKFADEITELEQLRQAGAITGDVFQSAFGKAKSDLLDAIDSMDKLKQSTQGVGAATQDSVAGFSAVYAAQREAEARNKQAAFRDAQMAMVNPAEIFAAVKPLLMPGMREQPNFAPDDATHRTQFSAMIERQIAYMQQHEADLAETKETIKKREEDSAKMIARLAEIRDASKDSKIVVKEYSL